MPLPDDAWFTIYQFLDSVSHAWLSRCSTEHRRLGKDRARSMCLRARLFCSPEKLSLRQGFALVRQVSPPTAESLFCHGQLLSMSAGCGRVCLRLKHQATELFRQSAALGYFWGEYMLCVHNGKLLFPGSKEHNDNEAKWIALRRLCGRRALNNDLCAINQVQASGKEYFGLYHKMVGSAFSTFLRSYQPEKYPKAETLPIRDALTLMDKTMCNGAIRVLFYRVQAPGVPPKLKELVIRKGIELGHCPSLMLGTLDNVREAAKFLHSPACLRLSHSRRVSRDDREHFYLMWLHLPLRYV